MFFCGCGGSHMHQSCCIYIGLYKGHNVDATLTQSDIFKITAKL